MNKDQAGFSLIELLIVVLVIGIVSASAIPNLLTARRAANEASAIATLRVFHYAGLTYQNTTGNGKVPTSLNPLFDLGFVNKSSFLVGTDYTGTPCYIKSGYGFGGAVLPDLSEINFSAKPVLKNGNTRTGTRNFIYLHKGEFYYYYSDIFSPVTSALVGDK